MTSSSIRSWFLATTLLGACGGSPVQHATDDGAPSKTSTDMATSSATDGSSSDDADVPGGDMASVQPSNGTATRPSYNTGKGFFVLDGTLYDANGNELRLRGVDRNHYDSNSAAGIAKSGANAVRIFVGTDYGATWPQLASIIKNDHIANKEVPIITLASDTKSATSCNTDPTVLTNVVNIWKTAAPSLLPLDEYSIINIANEWGPANSTTWRDANKTAIAALRQAGYLSPILVDAGGCGQDYADLEAYSQDVFDSDPQKNVMFALHVYGSGNDYSGTIKSIQKGTSTVVTLTNGGTCHPFAPSYCPSSGQTNTYGGITSYSLSGVLGMTQINGKQMAPANVGGTSGAWTVTLNVNSTSFGDYTSGGTIVDYTGNYELIGEHLAALRTTGAAYAITEFGPGRDIGPSPTLVTPLEIVTAAEKNGIGWLAWAWDDNNLGGDKTDNTWFGMTYDTGPYTSDTDLTIFGQQIVEGCMNPSPGGCGCPDDLPLPTYSSSNAVYKKVDPGCKGTPAPMYQPLSLKLAKPATVF